MPQTQALPRYVNFQSSPVYVFDEQRRSVTVMPWSQRHRASGGVFVVEGGHYQQFVGGNGPLYPFPDDESIAGKPLAPTPDDIHAGVVAAAARNQRLQDAMAATNGVAKDGRLRIAGEVVRKGTVVGETEAAFVERLRQNLIVNGLRTRDDFEHAPQTVLLSVSGINEKNLPRVREMVDLLFPKTAEATEPSDEGSSGDGEGEGEGDEVAVPTDEDGKPLTIYDRTYVTGLDVKGLRRLIDVERFDMSKQGPTNELRQRVLDALTQFKQLKG